jgi:hypothetical protein
MKQLFFPRRLPLDLNVAINTHIVEPYRPSAPPIKPDDKIACIGSCFAQEVAQSLMRRGKQTVPLMVSERLNTTFGLAHTLANAFDGTPFPEGFIPEHVTPVSHDLGDVDAFIITFGLSLCWYERGTNNMVYAVKESHSTQGLLDSLSQFEMRHTSVADNVAQIARIIEIIKRHRPSAPIVLTLSPIPLLTVTSGSAIAGNIISKSTLRVALHEIFGRNIDGVFYWPSYEIVEWVGKYISLLWGQGENDLRHLQPEFIDAITKRFIEAYFTV